MVDFVKKASLLCFVRDITELFIGKFTLTYATTKGEICSSFILDKARVFSIDINCSNISRTHFYSSRIRNTRNMLLCDETRENYLRIQMKKIVQQCFDEYATSNIEI